VGLTRLGVLGWPVGHSRSPAMHNAALRAVGLTDWRYQLLPVPPELFADAVRALPAVGFAGANVTIPHKHAALELATDATPAARAIGAANTLTFLPDGAIHADNTDAPGFLAALGDLRPESAVVLGAGGSARAVVYALAQAGAAVKVWNRTLDKARSLAAQLGAESVHNLPPADLLVNCTAIGLSDPSRTFKDLPLTADALEQYVCVVDLVYRESGDTVLLQEARRHGGQVVTGLEILVRQGALSFERWTGRTAPLAVMRQAVGHVDDAPPHDPGPPLSPPPSAAGHRRGGAGAGP
jgi:shikimate dehydrogenase